MDNRTIDEIRENETKLITEIKQLEQENRKLKKQCCERTDCSGRICNSKQYDSLVQRIENQQKEFIEWLKREIKSSEIYDTYINGMRFNSAQKGIYQDVLQNYKEIIGGKE